MKIYLARHGQSYWQTEPSHDWDSSLTPTGNEQARQMADWLASHKYLDCNGRLEVKSICSSPLKRAQETAEYVALALRLPIVTLPNLSEATIHVADHLPSRPGPFDSQPPYEPSAAYALFKRQVYAALGDLVDLWNTGDGPVLAVTHGGFIKTLLRLLANTDSICFRTYNASLSQIEWRRGRWHLVHLNLWDHLTVDLRTI